MLIGLPGSGKSTLAKDLAKEHNAIIHSSDVIREELLGDINNQSNNKDVFQELHKRIKKDLGDNNNVIYDACNIKYKRRMAFLSEIKKYDCNKICILLGTSYKDCLLNNKNREKVVPESVIKKMYMSFDTPYWYEGWDDIRIAWNSECVGTTHDFIQEIMNFDQDNPHHTYTLGEHCQLTQHYITMKAMNSQNMNLLRKITTASALHDCGKPFCKTYKTHKGEVADIAHYYSHEYVGGYNSLFLNPRFSVCEKLLTAIIIRWHMMPYVWEKDGNEKLHNKYKKLWGEELYKMIMIVHEADKAAH